MRKKDNIDDWDNESEDDEAISEIEEPAIGKTVRAKPGLGRRRYDELMEERRLKALMCDELDFYDEVG